jgi:hypothetical protein
VVENCFKAEGDLMTGTPVFDVLARGPAHRALTDPVAGVPGERLRACTTSCACCEQSTAMFTERHGLGRVGLAMRLRPQAGSTCTSSTWAAGGASALRGRAAET